MSTFILLPGAFHTAASWERVVPLLERPGHRVVTPNLAGVGDPTPASDISLALWTGQIANLVRAQSERVILVGHSRGGIVASMVAERVPERIAHLVYVSGSLLPDGGSVLTHGPEQDPSAPSPLLMRDDGMATLPDEGARHAFLNRTPGEWVSRALSNLVAEPVWIFAEPVRITTPRFGSVPRAYVETTEDNAVPIEVQRRMQSALPCDPVFTLEADHSPFYSDPVGLAEALHAISAKASVAPKS